MKNHLGTLLLSAAVAIAVAGCGGPPVHPVGSGNSGTTAQVRLLMTGAAPTGLSVLSFQATLSSAVLTPGNVSLLSSPVSLEVTRLQTEQALLNTQSVTAGSYTGITLTFANPVMTFENNGSTAVTIGTTTCAVATLCTARTPSLTNSSVTISTPVTITTNVPAAVLVNLDLASFLTSSSGTIAANAQATGAVTVTQLTSTSGSAFTSVEDVVGVLSGVNSTAGTFQVANALGTVTVSTSAGASGTAFLNFPASGSCAADFACLANGQIVSVYTDLQPNGTLLGATVFFEDAPSATSSEVEGIVVATSALTPPAQFEMVVLQETPLVSGLPIGATVTVAPAVSQTFDIDALNTGTTTNSYSFAGVQDLVIGQEVQVQMGTGSTTAQLVAPRVRLRSSRVTAQIAEIGLPSIFLGTLPPFLGAAGIAQIQAQVLFPPALGAFTEIGGTAADSNQFAVGNTVSMRGQLFKNSNTYPMVSTRIVKH